MKHLLITILSLVSFAGAVAENLDFGDHSSSTLTTKAWGALNEGKNEDAIGYASKCVELYLEKAEEMQKGLTEPVPTENNEEVHKMWALNDVGTCLFIQAQALEKQEKPKEALEAYRKLTEKVPFAQTWDTNGWFWKPADAAKTRIKALEFDSLD